MAKYCLFAVLLAVLLSIFVAQGAPVREREPITKEYILKREEENKKQIVGLVADLEQRMADHKSGKKVLADDVFRRVGAQLEVYSMKLASFDEVLDDAAIEVLMNAEKASRAEMDRLISEMQERKRQAASGRDEL